MVVAHSRPQTRACAATKVVAGTKIRWPQGHAGSTPARGTNLDCYRARRSDAGTHQMSMGPRRPRNSNCGSCRNELDRASPLVCGEILKAAAAVQENSTSPARARLQSLAATLTVSPTNVV